jgi:hypothetical protein
MAVGRLLLVQLLAGGTLCAAMALAGDWIVLLLFGARDLLNRRERVE